MKNLISVLVILVAVLATTGCKSRGTLAIEQEEFRLLEAERLNEKMSLLRGEINPAVDICKFRQEWIDWDGLTRTETWEKEKWWNSDTYVRIANVIRNKQERYLTAAYNHAAIRNNLLPRCGEITPEYIFREIALFGESLNIDPGKIRVALLRQMAQELPRRDPTQRKKNHDGVQHPGLRPTDTVGLRPTAHTGDPSHGSPFHLHKKNSCGTLI